MKKINRVIDQHKVRQSAPSLFDPTEVIKDGGEDKDHLSQDIKMSPFHLALLLASKHSTPSPEDIVYFGMKPTRHSNLSRDKAIPGRIVDWQTIVCNDKVFSSLRAAVVESRSSQGHGHYSSANGWKATYVQDALNPSQYITIIKQFREAFLQGLLLEGIDYHLLMEPEYLALFLVRRGIINQEDAFKVLSSMGYVNQRFERFPELLEVGDQEKTEDEYWSSLGRSHRTWRGNITKRQKSKDKKQDIQEQEIQAVLGALDDLEKSEENSPSEGVQGTFDLESLEKRISETNSPEEHLKEGEMYSFTGDVVDQFEDNVLRPQIPSYSHMRERVLAAALEFITFGKNCVLDLGSSRGEMFKEIFRSLNEKEGSEGLEKTLISSLFSGIDVEEEMVRSSIKSTSALLEEMGISESVISNHVSYEVKDLTDGILTDFRNQTLITSILTIQFTPIEYRQEILKQVYDALAPGGAFIWVEKIRSNSFFSEKLLTKLYYDDKARNGLSRDAIEKKRRAIERFLVPETNQGNEDLLRQAGFDQYKTVMFWRDLQFAAYLAVK